MSHSDPRLLSYISVINSINGEIKRLNARTKELREYKKIQEKKLFLAMRALNIDSSESYTKKSLEKKYGDGNASSDDKIRRTKKDKAAEALKLLRETGVPDPNSFLDEFKKTQRTYY